MRLPIIALIGFIAVVSAPVFAKEPEMRLPDDVASFKQRRDLCDHFRGEEPYDEQRKKFLERSIMKYCTGTDKELASLKRKYQNRAAVMRVLERYETKIEPSY